MLDPFIFGLSFYCVFYHNGFLLIHIRFFQLTYLKIFYLMPSVMMSFFLHGLYFPNLRVSSIFYLMPLVIINFLLYKLGFFNLCTMSIFYFVSPIVMVSSYMSWVFLTHVSWVYFILSSIIVDFL